jgi:hypothetical protein
VKRGLFRVLAAVGACVAISATISGVASAGARPHLLILHPFDHDFNNDGYSDLAIGIPGATVKGKTGAGAVEVIYGGPNGLHAAHSQLWSLPIGLKGAPHMNDHFGAALASGDFNSDGYDDLAIGIPNYTWTLSGHTYKDSGAILVLFGTSNGLSASHAFLDTSGLVDTNGHTGTALAACDMYDYRDTGMPDGYSDLAVGAPGTGYMTIISGHGLYAGQRSSVSMGANTVNSDANVGAAVTCGHILGQPLDEGVWGAPDASGAGADTPIPHSGVVFLASQLIDVPVVVHQSDDSGNPREAGDRFGAALAAADLDGNHSDDLIVGVPGEDLGSIVDSGAVSIFRSDGTGGFTSTFTLTEDTFGIPGDPTAGDHFGASVAAADLNQDGPPDLVVGVPGRHVSGHAGAGVVDVLINSGDGTPFTSGNQQFSQNTAGMLGTAAPGAHFGASVDVGFFGKGTNVDIVVGIPGQKVSGHAGAGAISVIYNRNNNTGVGVAGNQLWTRNSNGIAGSASTGDRFGAAVK